MTNRFLLALMSMTALVPATAMAQSEPDARGPRMRDRIERSGGGEAPGARAEFRSDVSVEAPPPQRTEAPRPRTESRREERPDRGDRGGFERRDPPRDGQGQIDREALRRDWPRTDGRGVQERREQLRREQLRREQWRREQGERDRWDRGTDWDRGNRDWNRGNEWNRDRDGNRGGWDGNRGNGQWDRGWRRDDRYDWNRYRQQNRSLYRLPRYYAPQGWGYGYRRFGVGITLNSFLFGSNYWINDPYSYRLPEVWGPCRWVRYYNDALLVDVRSGQVVDVEYDIFW